VLSLVEGIHTAHSFEALHVRAQRDYRRVSHKVDKVDEIDKIDKFEKFDKFEGENGRSRESHISSFPPTSG
jgi:hypothetical protein